MKEKKTFFSLFKNLAKNRDKEKFTLSPDGAHTAALLKKAFPAGINPQEPQDIIF